MVLTSRKMVLSKDCRQGEGGREGVTRVGGREGGLKEKKGKGEQCGRDRERETETEAETETERERERDIDRDNVAPCLV